MDKATGSGIKGSIVASVGRLQGMSPLWLVVIITIAAFLPVCRYAFVDWDDPLHVYQNPYLNPITASHLIHFWRTPYEGLYVPVSYMAFALLVSIARGSNAMPTPSGGLSHLDPHVFHIANLVLHLANVILVFDILRTVLRDNRSAAVGSLLFGIHPIQVEAVAWISELRGLLATLLALLAIREFLKYVMDERKIGRRVDWHSVIAIVLYGVGLLAKPSIIPVPLIALLLGWLAVRRDVQRGAWVIAAWSIIIIPCILLARSAQPTTGDFVVPFWQRPFVAGDALAFYMGKILWPIGLGEDYGRTPTVVLGHVQTYLIWLIPLIVSVAAWRLRDRCPSIVVAWSLFVIGLLPNLGFAPFIFQRFSTVADRYAYLAMLGPALFGAWALHYCAGRFRPFSVAAVSLTVFAAAFSLTVVQRGYWRNSFALFEHSLAVNPFSSTMHYDMGIALARTGRADQAVREYREAIRLDPSSAKAHCNLAALLSSQQDTNGAIAEFRECLSIDPNVAAAHYGLALLLGTQGRLSAASEQWSETIRLWPASATAHYNMGVTLYQTGNLKAAANQLHIAIALDPTEVQARQALQYVLAKQKRSAANQQAINQG